MAHRVIVPGDFVWIVAPGGATKTLYAVRSIPSGQEIRIYPLDNQTQESALVVRGDKWVVLGGENLGFTFEFKSGDPAYYTAINEAEAKKYEDPNIPGQHTFPIGHRLVYIQVTNAEDIDDAIERIGGVQTTEELDAFYADLSRLEITPQQFIFILQEPLTINTDSPQFTQVQVEWLLQHGLVPKTYDLWNFLGDYMIKYLIQIDQVSQASNVYDTLQEAREISDYQDIDDEGVIYYSKYFANKGYVPTSNEFRDMVNEPLFNDAIQILLEKNLITIDSQMLEEIRSSENDELIQIVQSLFPTKSTFKR